MNRTSLLYGFVLSTDVPFITGLEVAGREADLCFTCVSDPPRDRPWQQRKPVYSSLERTDDGEVSWYLYRLDDCDVLRFTGVADFYLWPRRIVCHRLPAAGRHQIETLFLGPVFAYWLEQRGLPAFHASAVVVDDRAVAFLAAAGSGKTSLAAAMLAAGHPLLTDDILAVERTTGIFVARPGYPRMRMWPDKAARFWGDVDGLELVRPGSSKRWVPAVRDGQPGFCGEEQPLGCCYLLERRPAAESGRVEIRDVSQRQAMVELLKSSFLPTLVESVGLGNRRFDFLSRLVQEVPVRRLVYSSGFERLPAVVAAVRRDGAPDCS